MDAMTAVRTVLTKKYATFRGRAARSEFWWWTLALFIANGIATLIDVNFLANNVEMVSGPGSFEMSHNGPLSGILALATILPSLAVSVRRLHDVGKSGWWLLIMFVPLIGFLYLLYLYVQRGTEGPNEHGPDPLAGAYYGEPGYGEPGPSAYRQSEPEEVSLAETFEAPPETSEPDDGPDDDPAPRSRPSFRPPATKPGFQTTQDRFRKK